MEERLIVLVDDHIVVRNGLAELIEAVGNYRVIGQYSNGQELLDALPIDENKKPDLLIIDLAMPFLDGEQTVVQLNERGYDIPILILTLDTDNATILRLYKKGVKGYLPKNCTADGLRDAIESIFARGYHQSDALYNAIMADEPRPDKQAAEREQVSRQLTQRELQFLKLVCNEAEYTYDQIADYMEISRRTVDGYRESIFGKFGIKSKTGLVLFALRYNLI